VVFLVAGVSVKGLNLVSRKEALVSEFSSEEDRY